MPGEDFDTGAALAEISSGLGLGDSGSEDSELDTSSGTDPAGAGDSGGSPDRGAPATPAESGTPAAEPDQLAAAPGTWRKEAAALWANLDPTVRQEILKREKDIFSGLEAYKADANRGRNFAQVIQPYEQIFNQLGIDPAQHIGSMLQAHHALATGTPEQKRALALRIMQDYGVDLSQPSGDSAPFITPEVQALQKEIQGLQSRFNGIEAQRFQTLQREHATQVEAFAADPANRYFDEVSADIVQLLQTRGATNLKDAYEKAVWMNPAVRAKEMTRLNDESKKAAETERLNRLKASKAAQAANVKSSPKVHRGTAAPKSMDDTLTETLAAIQARDS